MNSADEDRYLIYYDESGTSADTPRVAVAGLFSTEVQWHHFTRNWNETLAEFSVSMFHSREFTHSIGEYAKWKDHKHDPVAKIEREKFLRRLLSHIKLRVQTSFCTAVQMADYNQVNLDYPLRENCSPYTLCARTCLIKARDWAKKRDIADRRIIHVFEAGAEDQSQLKRQVERFSRVSPEFRKKFEADAVPLQAADMLAYEYFLAARDVVAREIKSFEELRYPIRSLEEIPHAESNWGFYTEQNIRTTLHNSGMKKRERQNSQGDV